MRSFFFFSPYKIINVNDDLVKYNFTFGSRYQEPTYIVTTGKLNNSKISGSTAQPNTGSTKWEFYTQLEKDILKKLSKPKAVYSLV